MKATVPCTISPLSLSILYNWKGLYVFSLKWWIFSRGDIKLSCSALPVACSNFTYANFSIIEIIVHLCTHLCFVKTVGKKLTSHFVKKLTRFVAILTCLKSQHRCLITMEKKIKLDFLLFALWKFAPDYTHIASRGRSRENKKFQLSLKSHLTRPFSFLFF